MEHSESNAEEVVAPDRRLDNRQVETSFDFLTGGGAMGRLMRAHDWAATPLSTPDRWPQSLRTSVSTCLNCSFPILIWWGADLVKLYNDAYAIILGAKHPSALGGPGREVWPEIWDVIGPMLARVTGEGEATPANDLFLMLERNGYPEECYFSFSYSPIHDESGGIGGVFCPVIETTQRVIGERRLRMLHCLGAQIANLHTVSDVLGEAAHCIGEEGGLQDFPFMAFYSLPEESDRKLHLGGTAGIGPASLRLPAQIPATWLQSEQPTLVDVAEVVDGEPPCGPWAVSPKRAVIVPLGFRRGFMVAGLSPHRPEEELKDAAVLVVGQISTGIAAAASSALERKMIKALEASEARLEGLFQQAPGFMAILHGSEHTFELANGAYSQLIGHRDLIGKPIRDALPDLEGQGFYELLDSVYATGEPFVGRGLPAMIQRGPGEPLEQRFVDFVYQPITDINGQTTGIFIEGADVTEQKRAEVALREINETLEARVAERSSELARAEEVLRHAQKMEAIGQLTGGVAHDFNNLLTIIRSSVDLLRKRDLPEERKHRYIEAIGETADRAAILTGQLLAFARRQPLKAEVFNAGEKASRAAEMLRTVVGPRIAITLDLTSDPCSVDADISQFETALINIAVNARDAMSGAGELTITVRRVQNIPATRGYPQIAGNFVVISVADTGGGIAPDELDQIFEPFFTTKEVGKGTGLGLSQVYGFAKQSGGEVVVASELGKGARFSLYLPEATRAVASAEDSGDRRPATGPAHGRILIVEDNEKVGDLAAQLLKDLGYTTTWVGDSASALEMLEMHPGGFDLVFSDVVMPGAMNGVELARDLKQRFPMLPVVLTSGYSDVLASGGAAGFELLRKPYSVEALSHLMRRLMN